MSMMKSAKTAIGKKVMAAEINAAPEALEISRKHCSTPCERKYRERALEIVPYGGAKRRGATQDGLKAKMETQNVTTLWLCDFWLNLRVSNGRWDANERSTVQKGRSRINGSACVERIQFYYVTFFPASRLQRAQRKKCAARCENCESFTPKRIKGGEISMA